ncbi:20616_t:CDS:2, partial [Cetraspora pellucida]
MEILSFYDIFIKKLNELDSVKTFTNYKYPLNRGACWNCERIGFSYTCCVACKQKFEQCDCKFICELIYLTQYNKCGHPCQFAKCRYFTNDLNNVIHQCKGKIELLHTLLQSLNTKKLINIAIDKYAAVGKTSVGEAIVNQYDYQFIDSGLFYQYVSHYYNNYSIDQIKQIFNEEQNKGFVVVEYNITILCLPDAEVKIILSADVETHIARHVLSQPPIKQAYNVLYKIDTTKLTLSEVVDMILIQ